MTDEMTPPTPAPSDVEALKAKVRDAHPRRRMQVQEAKTRGTGRRVFDATNRPRNERERLRLYDQIMELLAARRTNEGVAENLGWSVAELEVFLADHPSFAKERYDVLRRRLVLEDQGVKAPWRPSRGKPPTRLPSSPKAPAGQMTFRWSEEIRQQLLTIYVDTGDLMEAIEKCGLTPSLFNREVEENGPFAAALKGARKQAQQTLRMRAVSDALKGNDKLMSQIMKDGDDDDGARRLTDQQLATRIAGLVARVRSRIAAERAPVDDTGGAARVSGEPE